MALMEGTPGFFLEASQVSILFAPSLLALPQVYMGRPSEASLGGLEGESEWGATVCVPSPWQSSYRHYLISLRPASVSPGFQGKWLSFPPSLPCSPNPSSCRPREAGSAWKGAGWPKLLLGKRKFHPTGPVSQSRTRLLGVQAALSLGLLPGTSSGPDICQFHFSLSLCPGLCVSPNPKSTYGHLGQGLFCHLSLRDSSAGNVFYIIIALMDRKKLAVMKET